MLELLIVVSVLVILMVALVSLSVTSLATVQKSRLRTKAANIAQEGLENIRQKREEENTACLGYHCEWDEFKNQCSTNAAALAFPDPSPTGEIFLRTASCSASTKITDGVTVDIGVSWPFGEKTYNVVLETDLGPKVEGIIR